MHFCIGMRLAYVKETLVQPFSQTRSNSLVDGVAFEAPFRSIILIKQVS
jgi:hypothetical protein